MDDMRNYEPKRNNRFIVEFPEQFKIKPYVVQKINKPKFTDGKWNDIKIEFIDLVGSSVSKSLCLVIDFLKTKIESENSILFDIDIYSLDPTGVKIENWVINVEKVVTINFGDLAYGDDNIQRPYLIVKPLNCVLNY